MPVPSSGEVKFSKLQAEFGGSHPISLSEYYKGGTLIPSDVAYTNYTAGLSGASVPNVPLSGSPISLGSDFHSSAKATTYDFNTTPNTSGYGISNSTTRGLSWFNGGYFANTGDTFLITAQLHPSTQWSYANTMNCTLAITAGTSSSISVPLYYSKMWRLTVSYNATTDMVTLGGTYFGDSTNYPNGGAWLQGYVRTS